MIDTNFGIAFSGTNKREKLPGEILNKKIQTNIISNSSIF